MKYENIDIKMSRYDVYTFFIVRFFCASGLVHGKMTRFSVFALVVAAAVVVVRICVFEYIGL